MIKEKASTPWKKQNEGGLPVTILRIVAAFEILLRQHHYPSKGVVILMKNANGHSHRRAKKLPNVTDSVQKHQAGGTCARGGLGCWLPLPSPREGVAREAGLGVSRAQNGCVRARLLLACTFVPERQDSRAELSNVEREVQRKQGKRRPEHQETAPGGMVRLDSLGVPARCAEVKAGGYPESPLCPQAQKGRGAIARHRWHSRGTSIQWGRADNLVVESRRRPGEAGAAHPLLASVVRWLTVL